MAVEEAIGDATLHDETLAELGLSAQPFLDNKKSSRFSDSTTQKIRAEMEQNLRFGESLHLFVGDRGVGKTVFLSQLIKHCKTSIKPFVAKGAESFEAVAFLSAVLHQLDGDVEEIESISDHVDALVPLFEDLADDKMSVVLAIDDAHLAPIEEIAELIDVMGSFCKENGDKTARLLLTGEPKLRDELTAIADELDEDQPFEHTTTTLLPLDEDRVQEYLKTQLNQAGHTDAFPFTEKAVTKLHRESQGVPEKINSLAAKYLNTVYSGNGAAVGGKGFFSALGWPLLALGAAAMGLIAWGLSMFLGNNEPETTVLNEPVIIEPVASTNTTSTGAVVTPVETTVITPGTNGSATIGTIEEPTTAVMTPEVVSAGNLSTESVSEAVTQAANDATATAASNVQVDDDLLKPADRIVIQPEIATPEPVQQVTEIAENAEVSAEATIDNMATSTANQVTEQIIAVSPATSITEQPTENPAPLVTPPATGSSATATQQNVQLPSATTPVTVPNSVAVSVPQISTSGSSTSSNSTSGSGTGAPVAIDTDAGSDSTLTDSNGIAVAIDELRNTEVTAGIQNPAPVNTNATSAADNGLPIAVSPPAINRAIENERWVLFQAPGKFTVQLATSRERSYIINLAQSLDAEDPVAIYPFRTTNSQNPVFGLLSGLYETRSDAIAAVDRMASDTKQFGVWIRPIGDLQAEIKKQQ